MGCPCQGSWQQNEEGTLVCSSCGKVAPYQHIKSYAELLVENEKLKEDIKYYKKMWLGTNQSE